MKERIAFGAAAGVLLAAAVLLFVQNRVLHNRLDELMLDYEEAVSQTSQEGGVEVAMPEPEPQDTRFTFPIAASDYVMLTSPFGYRTSPILNVEVHHAGLDIGATWRAQVVAAADGVVVEHWPPPDGYYKGHDVYGGYVVLEHEDGWQTAYAHLSSSRVHTGYTVRAGEVIGRVGATGHSTGPHLHFEIRDAEGEPLNPLLYVSP